LSFSEKKKLLMDKIRRATWHDYTQRCIYMVTLKKSLHIEPFGTLKGDCRLPFDVRGSSYVSASHTGKAIKDAIRQIPSIEPKVKILQYALMPDHVHILLRVKERSEKHLGYYISNLKAAITKKWRNYNEGAPIPAIFADNYTDREIYRDRSLNVIFRYIRENPHRLAVRKMYPDFFRRVRNLRVGGKECQAYGNLFLLRNPFKSQVVIHRSNTEQENERLFNDWIENADKEGVLVSPFISPKEKAIRKAAEERGARIILIKNESFGERYKPADHDFCLCEEGKLLIIAPKEGTESDSGTLSRAACLAMNRLALEICNDNFE